MFRNKTARQHNFATVPRADIPRSKFRMRQTRKQAFNASELTPIMVEEVLPGDTWQHRESVMARLATPIAPVVDDIDLETFYFFVPNRITNPNWEDLITGEDDALTVPQIRPIDVAGPNYTTILGGVLDHMGIPPQTQTGPNFTINVMPVWAYFKIYNEWFRDQNLQVEWTWDDPWVTGTGTDHIVQVAIAPWNQQCLRANKRHDYITSSLPWPQKGSPVTFPLGSFAPVVPTGIGIPSFNFGTGATNAGLTTGAGSNDLLINQTPVGAAAAALWATTGLQADLASGVAPTLNAIRMASITQKLLEADARGGSRYVEQILSHFGVRSPDYRLQRPEYLGGSKIPITVNPIAQTAAYDAAPADEVSPIGNLGAEMHASGDKKTFTYAATEHGFIIGLAVVRATPTYQQGVRRHWTRNSRLDYWFPEFNGLGEQAVDTKELYLSTTNAYANDTWGYQERAAEYRYTPNEITGVLRSTAPQPLDWWHYAEEFGAEPALNNAFIQDKTKETLARSLATAPSEQWSAQIIMDILHDSVVARLMPAYGVPGIDRF